MDKIWKSLEEAAAFQTRSGFDFEYWDTQLPTTFRVAFDWNRKCRMFHIQVTQLEFNRFNRAFQYQGLSLEKFQDKLEKGFWISLTLTKKEFTDVFTVLCEDIISAVGTTESERRRIQGLIGRLEAWKSLFTQGPLDGLTREEQLGLWGELYVLHEYLIPTLGSAAVKTWKGPDGEIHDFQTGLWAIEVKSHAGNARPEHLRINGEHQLDDRGLDHLFLVMLSVARKEKAGESLPSRIEKIEVSLDHDPAMLRLFKRQLLQVGYYTAHEPLYENTGYTLREEMQWQVQEGFPRIGEDDLPVGVTNVQYSASVAAMHGFEAEWAEILSHIHP